MNEVFRIREAGQTEFFLRHLEGQLPDDPRIQEIGRLSGLSSRAMQKGELQSSLELEQSALAICRELRLSGERPSLLAIIAAKLYNIGQLHYHKREFEAARMSFEEAQILDRTTENIVGQAADCRGLAFIKQDLGDLRGAIKLHKQALKLDKKARFEYGIATDQANIGANYLELADPANATKYLLDALENFSALCRVNEVSQVRTLLQTVGGQNSRSNQNL